MHAGIAHGFSFIYILFGLLACFWGYRIFKVVLGMAGFIIGAYLLGSFTSAYMGGFGVVALIAGFAGGLIGGALFVTLYYFGVFVLGASAGWLFGVLITSAAGNTMHVLLFVILALIGGILAVMFQRLIITVSTAMLGAWYMVAGAFTFLGSEYTPVKMFSDPDSMTDISDGPGLVLLLSWLALSVSGMIFQYRYGPKKEKT